MMEILQGFNEPQLRAVTTTAPSCLVLAGAGSGKTRVLTSRIAYLLKEKGVSPHDILALTFTRKAAAEMKERFSKLVGDDAAKKIWCGTFHGISLRILEMYGSHLGYEKHISVYDEIDQQDVIESVIADLGLKVKPGAVIRDLQGYASDCDGYEIKEELAVVVQEYRARLKKCNAVDFTLILTETLQLIRDIPDVYNELHGRFTYLFVDEYQDTDRTQFCLHEAIDPQNIFVVGDVDQAIYGWRGSDIDIILGFQGCHKDAEIITLEQSYRCPKRVITAANSLISYNAERFEKTMWTVNEPGEIIVDEGEAPEDEAETIASKIQRLVTRGEVEPGNMAIITRTHAQHGPITVALDLKGIPYIVAGKEIAFWRHEAVREMIAVLKAMYNHRDGWHFRKVVRSMACGLTEKEWLQYQVRAIEERKRIYDIIIIERGGPLAELSRWFEENHSTSVSEALCAILDTIPARQHYADRGLRHKAEEIDKIHARILQWELEHPDDVTIGGFLQWLASQEVASEIDETNRVKVATIHAVKGLEFDAVFVAGMSQGILPHKRAIKSQDITEERRLFYVAITRAKRHLTLSRSKMEVNGLVVCDLPASQFLTEMLSPKEEGEPDGTAS
jgi:DNA helicase-2/ATP-dependent DNA helicase PcrA